jgi:hypothetical protein
MLSIARNSALKGNISRIAQRSIVSVKPLIVVPGQQQQQVRQRRQYTNGSATAEKVCKK